MTTHQEPVIALRDVNYEVQGHTILAGVSVEVYHGEIFGMMGMSGVGKSTLLRLIMGLIQPDAGEIVVLGQSLAGRSERQLNQVRRQMGMCFQGAALFDSMTVADNVAFGLRRSHPELGEEEIQRQVIEYLDIVGMEGTEDQMPSELSGGMRKRVGIARALIVNPEVMLYDEPTAGLDPIMSEVILDLIRKLREQFGMTSVIVTHEVDELFTLADRVIMLHQGRIIVEGHPENLRHSTVPEVRQFVQGLATGPIQV